MVKAGMIAVGVTLAIATGVGALATNGAAAPAQGMTHTSSKFAGPKANAGTVTHAVRGGRHTLTLSDDFKTPDTPDPHWLVVDSKGQTYLLDRLMLKGDRLSRTITLPAYVSDVVKVQIYCAWAEANLGEASFDAPLSLR